MDIIEITGGVPLQGDIAIGGGKNAALPLMTAALLSAKPLRLHNIPPLADVHSMLTLLKHLGCEAELSEDKQSANQSMSGVHQLNLSCPKFTTGIAPYDQVRKMRASVLVLGPLLARFGHAKVSLPGGCALGARPVDLHINGLNAMGATINIDQGYIHATAKSGLKGADISLKFPSVGATENLLMAASLAHGVTRISNAALEPEIDELAHLLNKMGAKITGIGSSVLEITGVPALDQAVHRVTGDRIEAGSYAIAAAMTRGKVRLLDAPYESLKALWSVINQTGVKITREGQDVVVTADHIANRLCGVDVITEPYPGFPTDLQAQFMALMTLADDAAMITEMIFENRYMHVPELQRMGANINLHGRSALIRGVKRLSGAPVMATDLRASMSLVIAGLAAEGKTQINRVYHLDRGYGRLVRKLAACGAKIERITK